MAIPIILAMTGAEIRNNTALPPRIAYLSCHFSPSNTGLIDLPVNLPSGSTIILDDSIPLSGHDPQTMIRQLSELSPDSLLLDFQRPPSEESQRMAETIVHAQLCPTAVTPSHGKNLNCPIFLPPLPLHVPFEEYLQPWENREIWLELALDALEITVTAQGSTFIPLLHVEPQAHAFEDPQLHCHYAITHKPDALRFYLYRTAQDIQSLQIIAPPNVTNAIGLYQELG